MIHLWRLLCLPWLHPSLICDTASCTEPPRKSPRSSMACSHPRPSYTALRRSAKINTHLVALTVHFARDRLTALAQAQGAIVKTVPEVLFVCVHNAGRSQMAAGLLHHHAAGAVHVRSAGSAPADEINPAVREAMAEIGLDISQEFPKPLTDDVVRAADVVITMGCGDACPIYPGKRYLDWELDDPAGKTLEQVRPIRADIDDRVQALLADLVPTDVR
jgi:arsenate reductase